MKDDDVDETISQKRELCKRNSSRRLQLLFRVNDFMVLTKGKKMKFFFPLFFFNATQSSDGLKIFCITIYGIGNVSAFTENLLQVFFSLNFPLTSCVSSQLTHFALIRNDQIPLSHSLHLNPSPVVVPPRRQKCLGRFRSFILNSDHCGQTAARAIKPLPPLFPVLIDCKPAFVLLGTVCVYVSVHILLRSKTSSVLIRSSGLVRGS